MLKNTVKVAAPAVLLAPVAVPILHGLSGIAVVGLGLFAAGTAVVKVVNVFSGNKNPLKRDDDASLV
ncbi:MAG: hypothetical protein FDX12_03610 [Chlorobium sp.]|nr:MAG: hypothetical protein FDX12_03610 [Chlorobium sp.]